MTKLAPCRLPAPHGPPWPRDKSPRVYFKCAGQVLLVGDFNVAVECRDVHPSMRFDELYAAEELEAMRELAAAGPYVDLWRRLHPAAADVFTCWDERTSARAFNRGLRIDYALATPELLVGAQAPTCEVVPVDVLPPKWSDHAGLRLTLSGLQPPPAGTAACPAWLTRREKLVDSRQRSIKDMFGGARKKPRVAEPAPSSHTGGSARANEQAASGSEGDTPARGAAVAGAPAPADAGGKARGAPADDLAGRSPKQQARRPVGAGAAPSGAPTKGTISAFFAKQTS